ncbi:hypothetical protein D915_008860 [Fasciola hepatica]|uniref:Uncharacterized protein n=1 Tax=Fasciola hepatica TaxID=6192 RepID=A0A4E0R1E2_FASHE|nr:hypothetical protein D915_008860 [Fasciola hepatica]
MNKTGNGRYVYKKRDHCIREGESVKLWHQNWDILKISPEELLKDELHLLKDPNRKRPEVPRHLKVNEADSPSTYIHVLPSPKPFPPTTSGEIGWRSGKEQYKLDKYNQQRAPQGNILLKFGWPIEATW